MGLNRPGSAAKSYRIYFIEECSKVSAELKEVDPVDNDADIHQLIAVGKEFPRFDSRT